MGKTNISWTNYSHNFWFGCKKVSPGCRSCYAERDMKRFGKDFNIVTKAKGFDKPLNWEDPAMVFTCSWSDFFIEEADDWRDDAWDIIRRTPHLTYQILTKRPENILSRLPDDWGEGYPNVWLGVSIESHKYSIRGWRLIDVPARVRFISAEPLLDWVFINGLLSFQDIFWVIVGGESGSNCRPMKLEWVRLIRDACKQHGVAFFMKQDAGPKPGMRGRIPDDLWIQEFPDIERK
jgi:protein gp37